MDIYSSSRPAELHDGRGQNKDTLGRQKAALEQKKRRTMVNKKIFEDLEKRADEELDKDMERKDGRTERKETQGKIDRHH